MVNPESMKGVSVWARKREGYNARRQQAGQTGEPVSAIDQAARYSADADAQMHERTFRDAQRQTALSHIPTGTSALTPAMQGKGSTDVDAAMSHREHVDGYLRNPNQANPHSYTRQGASQDPNARMSALGWSNRSVQGAPEVTRYDQEGRAPIYTNVPGNTAEWVEGGMRPGVNTINMRGAIEQYARANEISRGNVALRDGWSPQRGNDGGYTPPHRTPSREFGLNFSRRADERAAERARMQQAEFKHQSALEQTRGDQLIQRQEAGDVAAMGRQIVADTALLDRTLRTNQSRLEQVQATQAGRTQVSLLRNLYDSLQKARPNSPEHLELQVQIYDLLEGMGAKIPEVDEGDVQSFAEGGLVRGAGYGQTPDAQAVLPEINEYRDYAMGAQKLGLPAVPFEQFLTLRQGAQQRQVPEPQGAMAFAQGGMVPDPQDASGRMVVDPDPNAPIDSIPAVIDGEMPAKLDSGEFVIPSDVVQFFGTDKLNKMIAQARQGAQGV